MFPKNKFYPDFHLIRIFRAYGEARNIWLTSTPSTLSNRHALRHRGLDLQFIPTGTPEVEILNVSYNTIEKLPDYVFHNSSYERLKKILIYQNKINEISNLAFRGLKHLKMVDLSDNNLTTLDPYTFRTNTNLEKLVLINNNIRFDRLQIFLVSQSLETLILSNNQIDQIYEVTFLGVPNLLNLFLNGNDLIYISPNSFKTLTNLNYLSLSNTGIHRLSQNMFGNSLPAMVNLEGTPLATKFDPPLKKVMEESLEKLMRIDKLLP